MKKFIVLLAFMLSFSVFSQENKNLTVEIRKNGELVSKYETPFTGVPSQFNRTSLISYVKNINPIQSGPLKGSNEIVMAEFEYGTLMSYDKDMISVTVHDESKTKAIEIGDQTIQNPEYKTYKIEFPAMLTQGNVKVMDINGITAFYSLE